MYWQNTNTILTHQIIICFSDQRLKWPGWKPYIPFSHAAPFSPKPCTQEIWWCRMVCANARAPDVSSHQQKVTIWSKEKSHTPQSSFHTNPAFPRHDHSSFTTKGHSSRELELVLRLGMQELQEKNLRKKNLEQTIHRLLYRDKQAPQMKVKHWKLWEICHYWVQLHCPRGSHFKLFQIGTQINAFVFVWPKKAPWWHG